MDDNQRDMAQRHVNSLAHSGLAEFILGGVRIEDVHDRVTATAVCRRSRLRIIVHLVHYAGPSWEPAPSGAAPRPLTDQQLAIIGLCNLKTPVTAKVIARRLGKAAASSYLRGLLRELVRQRRLRRVDGGFVLP